MGAQGPMQLWGHRAPCSCGGTGPHAAVGAQGPMPLWGHRANQTERGNAHVCRDSAQGSCTCAWKGAGRALGHEGGSWLHRGGGALWLPWKESAVGRVKCAYGSTLHGTATGTACHGGRASLYCVPWRQGITVLRAMGGLTLPLPLPLLGAHRASSVWAIAAS